MTRLSNGTTEPGHRAAGVGVDPAPAMRARIGAALVAAFGCIALIVGVPLVLYYFIGSRWPSRGPVADDFTAFNLHPTTDLLLGVLAAAGWILWGAFVLMVIHAIATTTIDTIRWGVRAESWRDASNPVRWLAGFLIGAVVSLWPSAANAAPAEPVDPGGVTRELTADELAAVTELESPDTALAAECATQEENPPAAENEPVPEDTVDSHERDGDGNIIETVDSDPSDPSDDTLWGMAEEHYSDGTEYRRIFDHNKGITQSNGLKLTDPGHIVDGTEIVIPDTAPTADPTEPEPEQPPALEDPEPEPSDSETGTPPLEPEGEGEIAEPSAPPTGPDADPESTPDQSARPAEPEPDSAPAPTEETQTDPGNAIDTLPVGVWISGGTVLAASTIAALAVRARRRGAAAIDDGQRPVTGRLADLEALIAHEQHRLTEPAGSEPVTEESSFPEFEVLDLPVAADRARTIDLTELALPAIGLTGPGRKGAVRAAIITALDTQHPITITTDTADELDIDPASRTHIGPVVIAEDLEDAFNQNNSGPDRLERLLVCTEADLDRFGATRLAQQLALRTDRALVLGVWPAGPTATLNADGTLDQASGTFTGAEQFYIAEAELFHEVLTGYTEAAEAPASSDSAETPDDENDAEPAPVPNDHPSPADDADADEVADAAPGTGFRLCVFGDVDLYYNGKPVKLKQRARALTLLAALACADEGRTMDDLLDIVTADRPLKTARKYVNIIKANIRATVRELAGDDSIDPIPYDTKTETFSLNRDLITTDRAEFDDAEQRAALAIDPAERATALEQLVRLHTGDLAPDVESLDDLRTDYRAATQRACRDLADYHAEHGDPARAAKYRAMVAGPIGSDYVQGE